MFSPRAVALILLAFVGLLRGEGGVVTSSRCVGCVVGERDLLDAGAQQVIELRRKRALLGVVDGEAKGGQDDHQHGEIPQGEAEAHAVEKTGGENARWGATSR